jgi:glycosyltransferase AglD
MTTIQLFLKGLHLERLRLKSKPFSLFCQITLFIVALGVRIPWLWEVPRYIDELKEVNLAHQIYLGKIYPLHNMAHEIGALHNYILAGIFAAFGPCIYWPRLYVAITSALTVILIYHLGKHLYNQSTGIIAAGLLLTNGMHILVTHMAWSNCTTPFFFVLAFLAIVMAEESKNGKWLIISGLAWAFTLQTHSSVIIYILVIIGYILTPRFRQNTKIASKYYIFAGLAFAMGYANMLYYNVVSRGGSIGWIFTKDYTLEKNFGSASFIHNLGLMLIELIRSLSAGYTVQSSFWGYLRQPLFIGCLLILGLGIRDSIQKKQLLPLWFIIGGFMTIPWINHRYGFFITTRYIMPIVVCSILLLAYGIQRMYEYIVIKIAHRSIIITVFTSLLLVFGVVQLTLFYSYCSRLDHTDMSNRLSLKVVKIAEKWAPSDRITIIIDERIHLENDPLPVLLALSKHNYFILRVPLQINVGLIKRHPLRNVIQKYRGHGMVVIMSSIAYQHLKPNIPLQRVKLVSQRLILNQSKTSPAITKVYIAKLQPLTSQN